MSAPAMDDWLEANQDVLTYEFARLSSLLRGDEPPQPGPDPLPGGESSIDSLCGIFALSGFERDALLLTAGVEMDASLAALCASTPRSPQAAWPTFGLALAVLPNPHWSALSPVGPLRRWALVTVDESAGLTTGRLRVDERILHFLSGLNYLDTRLQPLVRTVTSSTVMTASQCAIANEVSQVLTSGVGTRPTVQLYGDDADGQEDVAARCSIGLGLELYSIDAADVPGDARELEAFATLWERESALGGAALMAKMDGAEHVSPVARLAARLKSPLFLASPEPYSVADGAPQFRVDKPDTPEQRWLWDTALGDSAGQLTSVLDGLASQYRLSARGVGAAAGRMPVGSNGSGPGANGRIRLGLGAPSLGALAQRIEPAAGWDDLVLPEAQKAVLRQIAAHVRHGLRVFHEWGFANKERRGLGVSALFHGESGTGKTMAAEVLATSGDFDLEIYRVDLSAVVSKYIGETEKNLRKVFRAAEEGGAILLFDEADALFGKRSEVKDSHDRYANIEVSYLLQRMETYRGLAILTTNHRAALDQAFQRRLRFAVQFPFPDRDHREAIWRGAFPSATPLGALDYGKLSQLSVSGGSIRNIALNAAFFAAEADEPIGMAHLFQAATLEGSKRERPVTSGETRGWV